MRILIVDDEATIRAILKLAVASTGADVYEADSAQSALDLALHGAPFDLVITDIVMPGMDGVELARRLDAEGCAGRFLFISGYCDAQSLGPRVEALHYRFLSKPFAIPELTSVVHSMLGESRSEAGKPRQRRASP